MMRLLLRRMMIMAWSKTDQSAMIITDFVDSDWYQFKQAKTRVFCSDKFVRIIIEMKTEQISTSRRVMTRQRRQQWKMIKNNNNNINYVQISTHMNAIIKSLSNSHLCFNRVLKSKSGEIKHLCNNNILSCHNRQLQKAVAIYPEIKIGMQNQYKRGILVKWQYTIFKTGRKQVKNIMFGQTEILIHSINGQRKQTDTYTGWDK